MCIKCASFHSGLPEERIKYIKYEGKTIHPNDVLPKKYQGYIPCFIDFQLVGVYKEKRRESNGYWYNLAKQLRKLREEEGLV
jgi:hypothetical protein